ncbi:MAG: UvrD-helicase domain-containing protein [Woeseiaceae bacterium]|nr:UvrD-helicase domain-containing protein [Woeseiaceae bacterium]
MLQQQQAKGEPWTPGKWGRRLARNANWTAELNQQGLRVDHNDLAIDSILEVSKRRGLVWSKVTILSSESEAVILGGLTGRVATRFVQQLLEICSATASRRLRVLLGQASHRKALWRSLLERPRWLATSEVKRFMAGSPYSSKGKVQGLLKQPFMVRAVDRTSGDDISDLITYLDGDGLLEEAEERNDRFLAEELVRFQDFFDSVEKNPLTDEQRCAVVTQEDSVMTVAAAGSGKTSVMVAKAGYAVMAGIYEPSEILLLAFNRKAAEELKERVEERLGPLIYDAEKIRVATFHALGLSIVSQATGRAPHLAPWVERGQELKELSDIVTQLSSSDDEFASDWRLFKNVFARPLPPFGSKEEPEAWDPKTGERGFRTIRGEIVKSREERMICDWLADRGIAYEYERPYEIDTATSTHRQYLPDFYYPSASIYHEHFALDKHGRAPEHFVGYVDGVHWKRALHKKCDTTLIETTSYGIRREDGFDILERDLIEQGVAFAEVPLTDEQVQRLADGGSLLKVFRTFLSHAKSNRLSMQDLRRRAKSKPSDNPKRDRLFLDLFEKLWSEWERRLRDGGYVDFDDMLGHATDYLARGQANPGYKLIMADEFQDTSRSRALLLRELSRADDARLFVVGDDWQAVNRFAGADISLMRNFGDFFGDNRVVNLTHTFRCPADLNALAGEFVMANPFQIRKEVVSANRRQPPSVICFKLDDIKTQEDVLASHLRQLADKQRAQGASERVTAYVLGRNNFNKPVDLPILQSEVGDVVDLNFSTVHAAKGLEADYVFIMNMIEGTYGFPSMIADDSTLWMAMPDGENFPYAEERRLFYVALTRAKRLATLYTDRHRRSEFIAELEKIDTAMEIRAPAGESKSLRSCPRCGTGEIVLKKGRYGEFLSCTRFPKCDYSESVAKPKKKKSSKKRFRRKTGRVR